jgi:hypothetical protein
MLWFYKLSNFNILLLPGGQPPYEQEGKSGSEGYMTIAVHVKEK